MVSQSFIEKIWKKLTNTDFSLSKFFDIIRLDGGLDTETLTEDLVSSLLNGEDSINMEEIVFPISELLAYYSCLEQCGKTFKNEQVVVWVFCAFIIGDLVKNGYAEWELQFNTFVNGFYSIMKYIDIDDKVFILHSVFS